MGRFESDPIMSDTVVPSFRNRLKEYVKAGGRHSELFTIQKVFTLSVSELYRILLIATIFDKVKTASGQDLNQHNFVSSVDIAIKLSRFAAK